jgi:hypothetical protein
LRAACCGLSGYRVEENGQASQDEFGAGAFVGLIETGARILQDARVDEDGKMGLGFAEAVPDCRRLGGCGLIHD